MKLGKTTKIGLISTLLLMPAVIGLVPASIAGSPPSSAPLIDKEFETSLRKFVSKRFFNRIDASEDQREKISKIMADTQEQTRPNREQFRRNLLDLSSMMSNEKVGDEEIKQKVAEVRALKQKISDQRLEAALQVRKILSAEQRKKIHHRIAELITGGNSRKLGSVLNKRVSLLDDAEAN